MNNRNTFNDINGSCDSKTPCTVYIQTTVSYRSYTVNLEELHCTLQAANANTDKTIRSLCIKQPSVISRFLLFHLCVGFICR